MLRGSPQQIVPGHRVCGTAVHSTEIECRLMVCDSTAHRHGRRVRALRRDHGEAQCERLGAGSAPWGAGEAQAGAMRRQVLETFLAAANVFIRAVKLSNRGRTVRGNELRHTSIHQTHWIGHPVGCGRSPAAGDVFVWAVRLYIEGEQSVASMGCGAEAPLGLCCFLPGE